MKGIENYLFAIFVAVLFLTEAKKELAAEKIALLNQKEESTAKTNAYGWLLFACFLPVFLATFRHVAVGTDTGSVYHPYYYMPYCVFGEKYTGTEPGFYLVIKIGYLIFRGFPGVLFCVSILTTLLSFYAIAKLSDGRFCFLAAAYILAFWYFDSFNIMRQTLAAAITVFSWRYLKTGEIGLYSLGVLIAAFFHNSALFALIGVLFYRIRDKKLFFFSALTALPFLVFLLPAILSIFQNLGVFIKYIDRYKGVGFDFSPVNFSLVLYRLPVYFLFLRYFKRLYKQDGFTRVLLLFAACSLGAYLCKIRMVWLTRLSGYTLFSEGFLVEKCAKFVKNKPLYCSLVCLYTVFYFVLIYGVFKNGEILPFAWGVF